MEKVNIHLIRNRFMSILCVYFTFTFILSSAFLKKYLKQCSSLFVLQSVFQSRLDVQLVRFCSFSFLFERCIQVSSKREKNNSKGKEAIEEDSN